jgi:hypothetical protein
MLATRYYALIFKEGGGEMLGLDYTNLPTLSRDRKMIPFEFSTL